MRFRSKKEALGLDITESAMVHSLLLCLTLLLLFQALRSFKLTVTVDPKYHPKIIGRKGAVITQIRTEHEVNIQFPDKDDESQVREQRMHRERCWLSVGTESTASSPGL